MEEKDLEKQREIQVALKNAVENSNILIKDFKVYFATFQSDSKNQMSHLTKEEYDAMQTQKFIGSEHEKMFFEDLPEKDKIIDVKTYVLTKDNFALAFHPMVWKILNEDERITVCRIARQTIVGKDFKQFCLYNSHDIVLDGKNYDGSLNLGTLFNDNVKSHEILIGIANGENVIKDSFYIDKMKKRNGVPIDLLEFKSFEEMQYILKLKPLHDKFEEMEPREKAYYYDQIYNRRFREASQKSFDLIAADIEGFEEFTPWFARYVKEQLKNIMDINILVMSELGTTALERDRDYLQVVLDIKNRPLIDEYNKIVVKYNELVKTYNNPIDAIEKMDCQEQLDKLGSKMERLQSKRVAYEQAVEKHFEKHFVKKEIKKENKTSEGNNLSQEELAKMN